MKMRRLGLSGLYVSELSLGTMLFGEKSDRSTAEAEATRMVHAFIDRGGTHIDTANVYADGRSEEIIGRALSGGRRDKVTIATKARFGTTPERDSGAGLSRRIILREVESSLRRLNTDVVDLYYMHGWDPDTPIEESLRAYDDLVRTGKVRYIGVSNFRSWQVMQAIGLSGQHGWARFIAGQYQYSLVVRDIEYEFASLFDSQGLGLMAWGPLGGGFLSGKYSSGDRPTEGRIATTGEALEEAWHRRATERNWLILSTIERIAKAHGTTMSQISLAWLRTRPFLSSVILGARTFEQFEDNIGAAEIEMTPEEIDSLGKVSAPNELYPYRMMQVYGME